MLQALGKRGAYFGCAPVLMIVPTCSPRSAAVSRPGTRPFTTCTRSRWRAVAHDFEERAVERQRSLMLCEIGRARLAQHFRLLSVRTLRIGIVHAIDVLDDGEPRRAERVGEQKGAGVGAVRRASASPGTHGDDREERRCPRRRGRRKGGSRAGSRSCRARCRRRLPAPAARRGCGRSDRLRSRPAAQESRPEGRGRGRRYKGDARGCRRPSE